MGISEESFEKKLLGFAADGAAVNRREKDGIIGILRGRQPWVIYVWCVAHRLELFFKRCTAEYSLRRYRRNLASIVLPLREFSQKTQTASRAS